MGSHIPGIDRSGPSRSAVAGVPQGLLTGVCSTYAELLRRQRNASSPFVRWVKQTGRAHDFAWLGPNVDRETLITLSRSIQVEPGSGKLAESIRRMHGTAALNPYEREIVYGYPYVIGKRSGKPVRAPLLTIPVTISPNGKNYKLQAEDEVVRFNSLALRGEDDSFAHDAAISRVLESTPSFPVESDGIRRFVDIIRREFPAVAVSAVLDGCLGDEPDEPVGGDHLIIIDQAALFVAPKGSYFLTSDLEAIAELDGEDASVGALAPLLTGAGADAVAEFSSGDVDAGKIYYPFSSNRSQRKVALLVDDPGTRLVRVEGPPGTGKSLTIANLACHIAATGRSVLITSQKDKALEVVDEKLRQLGLAELPMTLLRHDKDSKKDLLRRIESVRKRRAEAEVVGHHDAARATHDQLARSNADLRESYSRAIEAEAELEKAHRSWQTAARLQRTLRRISLWRTAGRAERSAPKPSDELAAAVSESRVALEQVALDILKLGAELQVAGARRDVPQRRAPAAQRVVGAATSRSTQTQELFDV
jgi:hypothetical protein